VTDCNAPLYAAFHATYLLAVRPRFVQLLFYLIVNSRSARKFHSLFVCGHSLSI